MDSPVEGRILSVRASLQQSGDRIRSLSTNRSAVAIRRHDCGSTKKAAANAAAFHDPDDWRPARAATMRLNSYRRDRRSRRTVASVRPTGGNGCGFKSDAEAGSAAASGLRSSALRRGLLRRLLRRGFLGGLLRRLLGGFLRRLLCGFLRGLSSPISSRIFFAVTAFFLAFLPFAFFAFLALAIVVLLLPPIQIDPAFQVFRFSAASNRSVQSWPRTACRPVEKLNRVNHRD